MDTIIMHIFYKLQKKKNIAEDKVNCLKQQRVETWSAS